MRNRALLLFVAAAWCMIGAPVRSATEPRTEVEARFLVTFFKFIRWPHPTSNATICFFGDSAVRDSVLDAIRRDTSWIHLKDRTVVTKVLTDSSVTDDCNVLWIDASIAAQVWREAGVPEGVFTVSDSRDFAHNGGMFEFKWLAGENYRLAINVANVARSGLIVSGALGTLADRIDSERSPF